MSNVFIDLPLPAFNGPGTAVDTSLLGIPKTLEVVGNFAGTTIAIEISEDGGTTFAPVATFQNTGKVILDDTVAEFMRVNVRGRRQGAPFSADAGVAAPAGAPQFAAIALPVGGAAGVPTDISELGAAITIVVGGSFPGEVVEFETSVDGTEPYAPLFSFAGRGGQKSAVVTASFIRTRAGSPSSATAALGATPPTGALFDVGPTYGLGPTIPGILQPEFVTPQEITTIYARTGGNDTTGDGTLANPYETAYQRAARDVPAIVPPGVAYVIDNTDLTEALPNDYELPSWKAAEEHGYNAADPYFQYNAAVTFRATPRLVAAIPAGDAVVPFADIASQVAQTGCNLLLVTFTTARASWAANALKGKQVIQPTHATPASVAATILESTDTTLLITATAALTVGISIMEASATITVDSTPTPNADRGGLNIYNIDSVALNGQRITQRSAPATSFGLLAIGKGQLVVQQCELQNPQLSCGSSNITKFFNNWVYGERFRANELLACVNVLFDAVDQFAFLNMELLYLNRCGVFGGGTAGTLEILAQAPGSTRFGMPSVLKIESTWIKDILGATADGVRFNGGKGQFDNVLINGCGRDGVRCEDDIGFLRMNNVRSTVANGVTTASGVGVRVNDGMQVRVDAATSAAAPGTILTGVGGDMKVGSLPVRTWADFVANAPVKNEYDLRSPFATNVVSGLDTPSGDEVAGANTGGCSGSRIFQRT